MSNFINLEKEVIFVVQNQNGAQLNHGLTQIHKLHYTQDFGKNHHYIPYNYSTTSRKKCHYEIIIRFWEMLHQKQGKIVTRWG